METYWHLVLTLVACQSILVAGISISAISQTSGVNLDGQKYPEPIIPVKCCDVTLSNRYDSLNRDVLIMVIITDKSCHMTALSKVSNKTKVYV